MSNDTMDQQQDMPGPTKPVEEHKWLERLIGEWKTETEMNMPDGSKATGHGTESVRSLGGLWALAEGKSSTPDGSEMEMVSGIGYDVSFKEYRGFWAASMSSHLWKSTGTLSEDGKKMTLDCVGPNMEKEGETANYRDVIEFQDDNNRTLTSYWEDENGAWQEAMVVKYTRV